MPTQDWTKKKGIPKKPGTYDVTLGQLLGWKRAGLIIDYAHNRGALGLSNSRVKEYAQDYRADMLQQISFSLSGENGNTQLETREGHHRLAAGILCDDNGDLGDQHKAELVISVVPESLGLDTYRYANKCKQHSGAQTLTNPEQFAGNLLATVQAATIKNFGKELADTLFTPRFLSNLALISYSVATLSPRDLNHTNIYRHMSQLRKVADLPAAGNPLRLSAAKMQKLLDALAYYLTYRSLIEEEIKEGSDLKCFRQSGWFLFVVSDRLSEKPMLAVEKTLATQCKKKTTKLSQMIPGLTRYGPALISGVVNTVYGTLNARKKVK